jgi:hypothetical protein
MRNTFVVGIGNKQLVRRTFLVRANSAEEADKIIKDTNVLHIKEGDEPLFMDGESSFILPVEFENNIMEV